jgi:guanine deaminase
MNPKFLHEAIRLSLEKSRDGEGGPFGAVIVRNDEIIGQGWNRVTSTNDPTAHAEMMAIRDACRRLQTFSLAGCDIYTSCEPCPMCLAAIYWARLDRVYYAATRQDAAEIGFDDSRIYDELAMDIGNRSIPMTQDLHDEARDVFLAWLQQTNRILY